METNFDKVSNTICKYFYEKGVCWYCLLAFFDETKDKESWFTGSELELAKGVCRYLYEDEICIDFYPLIYEEADGKEVFRGSHELYEYYLTKNHLTEEDVRFEEMKTKLHFDERDYEEYIPKE